MRSCSLLVLMAATIAPAGESIRVATYNVSLYRGEAGRLAVELDSGEPRQAQRLAEVIQRVRPDVLLLCEIDYDPKNDTPRLFVENYLNREGPQELDPIDYPYRFSAPVNTGEPSGIDLNFDGRTDGPNDAWGFGRYPGQYGMAVLSRFPIEQDRCRTFQRLLWSELPAARRPIDPASGSPHHPDAVWERLRLPSKSLWDVVVQAPSGPLHLLCSHPTPPVFDGPEDLNGCRNADEIRLLTDYADGRLGNYFVDDAGRAGALGPAESFVVLGDLNADPNDGDDGHGAIDRLLASPRVAHCPAPRSGGGVAAAQRGPELNADQTGDPAEDTANFGGDGVANMRVDYVLPSADFRVVRSGVYWPRPGEPGAEAATASDHRLVWVDIKPAGDGTSR